MPKGRGAKTEYHMRNAQIRLRREIVNCQAGASRSPWKRTLDTFQQQHQAAE